MDPGALEPAHLESEGIPSYQWERHLMLMDRRLAHQGALRNLLPSESPGKISNDQCGNNKIKPIEVESKQWKQA